jgi:hypothetical protein
MTAKKAEASQAPPYRKRKSAPPPVIDDEDDASGSITQSDEDTVGARSPAKSSTADEEETFESTLKFDVIQSAYVDKEKLYTKSRTYSIADKMDYRFV